MNQHQIYILLSIRW